MQFSQPSCLAISIVDTLKESSQQTVTDLDLPLTAEDARFKQIMIRDFIHI
jgi:hypothetical protein